MLCIELEADSTTPGPQEPGRVPLKMCSGVLDLLIALAGLREPVAGGGVLERLLGAVNIDRGLFISVTLVVLHKVAPARSQQRLRPAVIPYHPRWLATVVEIQSRDCSRVATPWC